MIKDVLKHLKNAEHIVNVTFKNNRSLETINSFIKELVSFYDGVISFCLEKYEEELPKTPVERAKLFVEKFPDLEDIVNLYLDLRKCIRAEVEVKEEHRKNIEVIYKLRDKEVVVNLKVMKDLLEVSKQFLNTVANRMK